MGAIYAARLTSFIPAAVTFLCRHHHHLSRRRRGTNSRLIVQHDHQFGLYVRDMTKLRSTRILKVKLDTSRKGCVATPPAKPEGGARRRGATSPGCADRSCRWPRNDAVALSIALRKAYQKLPSPGARQAKATARSLRRKHCRFCRSCELRKSLFPSNNNILQSTTHNNLLNQSSKPHFSLKIPTITMFSKVAVAASMASVALALPQGQAPVGDSGSFSLISSHSGDTSVHLRTINANGQGFWIGKPVSSYCPESTAVDCSAFPGDQTVFATGGTGSLSLDVNVPGGQQIFVAPDGKLSYTQAHSANIPTGSVLTPFTYTHGAGNGSTGTLEGPGKGFYACPSETAGEYFIAAAISDDLNFDGCTGIGLATADDTKPVAWQYT
ncbi:hypothetical protein FH972_025217 [Carpinus fangiana]|uniref:IgE-binding protein n=1 Tax=Carpinus fangiana TaxID=176857 RepID=A0A5N6L0Q6_9ROSI|nr:hypothetical protein FH972_025217 [Carpinus fangiana]